MVVCRERTGVPLGCEENKTSKNIRYGNKNEKLSLINVYVSTFINVFLLNKSRLFVGFVEGLNGAVSCFLYIRQMMSQLQLKGP